MSTTLSRSRLLRVLPVAALCLLTPLIGTAQRFGGASLRLSQGQAQQTPPAQPGQVQRSGPSGRPDQLLSWEWWKDEGIKKELGLKDSQVRSITRLYEDRSRQMKPHSDEFQKEFAVLEKMTRERAVDVATYSIQVTRVEALRTELNKTRTVMLYSISRMLTPEQNDKLREIRDRRRSGRGGGGAR